MKRLFFLLPLLLLACSTASMIVVDPAPSETVVLPAISSTTKNVGAPDGVLWTTPTPDSTVCTDALNVRSGPALTAPVVSWLERGDRVRVLESVDGWAKIGLGWVRGVYLCP